MSFPTSYLGGLSSRELERAIASGWKPVCHITYTRDAWVKLLQPPSEYSDDEAKLLCQEASDNWVAWVPNHGEVILNQSHFYC
ncbi:MAG: hypothetical protein KME20_03905 [Kaiparowitsia implicata GSE-PSE-MK54-09C]|jgi:hypothetical protein|nr:hypothetical protein [Kaiparowitsia implicata GSE-PSE-MK54-09C]